MIKDVTTIVESTRQAFGITRDEYALCSYIQFRIADPRNTKPGWCTDSKDDISKFVGITRQGLYKMVERMEAIGLLETVGACSAVRVTAAWIDANTGCKQSLQSGNKKCKLSLQKSVNKVTPIIKEKDDIVRNNNAESEKDSAYSFPDFWKDYAFPRGSKRKACERWGKLTGRDRDAIKQTLPYYLRSTTTTRTSDQKGEFKPMRKYPEFYLSARVWESQLDELATQIERDSIPTEYDEAYSLYLDWVKRKYPALLQETKHMSKSQYIEFKTTYYVQGKSILSRDDEQMYMIRAHEQMQSSDSTRSQYPDVFAFHCQKVRDLVNSQPV